MVSKLIKMKAKEKAEQLIMKYYTIINGGDSTTIDNELWGKAKQCALNNVTEILKEISECSETFGICSFYVDVRNEILKK